jgi:hypothetical protein
LPVYAPRCGHGCPCSQAGCVVYPRLRVCLLIAGKVVAMTLATFTQLQCPQPDSNIRSFESNLSSTVFRKYDSAISSAPGYITPTGGALHPPTSWIRSPL